MKRLFPLAALACTGCAEQPNPPSRPNVVAAVRARPSTIGPETPVAGSLYTSVSGRNIADVARDVQGWHDMQHANCKFIKVLGAEIISQGPESVTEHWTIEACKQQAFTCKVLVVPGTGALTDAVSNLDGSPLEPVNP